nr:RsmE family RNA methyltransferase [Lachnospiraceae bacterium]
YELAGDMSSTRRIMSEISGGARVGVFIGPEGGFDETEVTRASEKGFVPITLGRRILRTETAAMTVMGWLVYLFDDRK